MLVVIDIKAGCLNKLGLRYHLDILIAVLDLLYNEVDAPNLWCFFPHRDDP